MLSPPEFGPLSKSVKKICGGGDEDCAAQVVVVYRVEKSSSSTNSREFNWLMPLLIRPVKAKLKRHQLWINEGKHLGACAKEM